MAVRLDGVVQLVQKFPPITRQKVTATNGPLLQAFVRIKRLTQTVRMTAHQFALLRFRTRRLRLQRLELILHLRPRRVRRIHQRPIELLQLFFDARKV